MHQSHQSRSAPVYYGIRTNNLGLAYTMTICKCNLSLCHLMQIATKLRCEPSLKNVNKLLTGAQNRADMLIYMKEKEKKAV